MNLSPQEKLEILKKIGKMPRDENVLWNSCNKTEKEKETSC